MDPYIYQEYPCAHSLFFFKHFIAFSLLSLPRSSMPKPIICENIFINFSSSNKNARCATFAILTFFSFCFFLSSSINFFFFFKQECSLCYFCNFNIFLLLLFSFILNQFFFFFTHFLLFFCFILLIIRNCNKCII